MLSACVPEKYVPCLKCLNKFDAGKVAAIQLPGSFEGFPEGRVFFRNGLLPVDVTGKNKKEIG